MITAERAEVLVTGTHQPCEAVSEVHGHPSAQPDQGLTRLRGGGLPPGAGSEEVSLSGLTQPACGPYSDGALGSSSCPRCPFLLPWVCQ